MKDSLLFHGFLKLISLKRKADTAKPNIENQIKLTHKVCHKFLYNEMQLEAKESSDFLLFLPYFSLDVTKSRHRQACRQGRMTLAWSKHKNEKKRAAAAPVQHSSSSGGRQGSVVL